MDEETLLKGFEEWAKSGGYFLDRNRHGFYIADDTKAAFESWLESARRADKRAREECAATVATLAERPYDNNPEFSALLHAEAAIRATIPEDRP